MAERPAGHRRQNRSGWQLLGADVDPRLRIGLGMGMLLGVLVIGTLGYWLLGLPLLESVYQAVETVSTVGFGDIKRTDPAARVFTIILILVGVGIVLYTLSSILETFIEGRLTDDMWRRRMRKDIESLSGHVLVCGCGRLGRAVADYVASAGHEVVVVDRDEVLLEDTPYLFVAGDATSEAVLRQGGLERASTLVTALNSDADNVYLTLSARALNPALRIIARAHLAEGETRLHQAGADRVINPLSLGGARAGAMALQPHVAEFVDVITHERSLEFRLEEFAVPDASPIAGLSLRDAQIRDRSGALILAMRRADGGFVTNPSADTAVEGGVVLIAIGTLEQLEELERVVAG